MTTSTSTSSGPVADSGDWPELAPPERWAPTYETVLLWSQVVGKVRLALMPMINHWWQVPFYVNSVGLTTSLMPHRASGGVEVVFDLQRHVLTITTVAGQSRELALEPRSVADFHGELLAKLGEVGVAPPMLHQPVEVPVSIPFAEDHEHASYDADAMHRVWRALVSATRVLTEFRGGFVGKVSPVHFFWGAFDLAVTRFSGRTAPRHPGGAPNCADWVMVEGYSHELASAGLWPGPQAAVFYAYAYPQPAGYEDQPVTPEAARWDGGMGEFLLPYDAVRTADDPDAALLGFLQSTYVAAADLGDWDRAALERGPS